MLHSPYSKPPTERPPTTMQMKLYAPDVTCEHCIASIKDAVNAVEGATFVSGDPDSKSFIAEVASGAILDQLAAATEAEGYPLGEVPSEVGQGHTGEYGASDWLPEYTVTATDKGADVNYTCYCGCDAGFAFDRSQAEQSAEGCCCGNRIMVAPADVEAHMKSGLEEREYRIDVQEVTAPWGQPLQTALAVPVEN